MSCRISMAQVRGAEAVGREAAGECADGAVKAGVDKARSRPAADYPICSGWPGRSCRFGGPSRHSEELRPVQASPLPGTTRSNGIRGEGFKNRPAKKIKMKLSTCRHHTVSSNIAGRVIVEIGSRGAVTPRDSGEKGF